MKSQPTDTLTCSSVCKSFSVPENDHVINYFNRRYKETVVLENISFNVKKGECLGFLGRNGSGKSTLLKIVTGVMDPTSGAVNVPGALLPMLEIGTGFNPELNAVDNITLYSALLGLNHRISKGDIEAILKFAEVSDSAYKQLKHFSSGMYMRLAFAVASYHTPDFIILDEVLAVGDPTFQAKCIKRMKELKNKAGLLFVSHNMDQIRRICDRVIILENGRVYGDYETEEGVRTYLKSVLKEAD
jgi:ABC-type polysaccharide/polyol phosphate transport system ATPase subunit